MATKKKLTNAQKLKGCKCGVCGRRYKVDILLPDQMWQTINPEGHELLCGSCIVKKIEKIDQFGALTLRPMRKDWAIWNAILDSSKPQATADSIGKGLE